MSLVLFLSNTHFFCLYKTITIMATPTITTTISDLLVYHWQEYCILTIYNCFCQLLRKPQLFSRKDLGCYLQQGASKFIRPYRRASCLLNNLLFIHFLYFFNITLITNISEMRITFILKYQDFQNFQLYDIVFQIVFELSPFMNIK